jgi:hypothetical protein
MRVSRLRRPTADTVPTPARDTSDQDDLLARWSAGKMRRRGLV